MDVLHHLPLRPGIVEYDKIGSGDPAYIHPAVPGLILRTIELLPIEGANTDSDEPISAETHAYAKHGQALHAELGLFGIEVAPYTPLLTNDRHTFILAVREVAGTKKLEENYHKAPPEEQQAADVLIKSLFQYFEHKIETGEPYLGDIIGMHQYLYSPEGTFVLVDVDPLIIYGRENELFSFEGEIPCIEKLVTEMRSMYANDHVKLTTYTNKARALLLNSARKNDIYAPEEVIDRVLASRATDRNDISGNLELALRRLPQNREYYRRLDEYKKQQREAVKKTQSK